MQSLLAYGSDSDDDSSPSAPLPPSTSSSSSLSLPSPRSSSSALNLPAPKSTAPSQPSRPPPALPIKKPKQPKRFVLDLPPPSASPADGAAAAAGEGGYNEEPAKKRPKIELGKSGGLTGLAAMLPKPKNEVKPPPPAAVPKSSVLAGGAAGVGGLFDGEGGGEGEVKKPAGGPMFLPPALANKGKGKAAAPPAPPPAEPAVDFFGIGSVTSAPSSSSSSSSSSLRISSAPSISSAPKTSLPASPPPPAQSKQPTAADPYPGFTQLPSGEWVAKDQETYEMWMAWQAQQQAASASSSLPAAGEEDIPRGFGEKDMAGGLVDVDESQRAREAWASRPGQVVGKEGEYKKASEVKGISKHISGGAKRKHQLSSLLAAAHDNRAELEDRIAQARANRKSAGNKYGF
ncbi:hypothetical protein JCM8547_001136 [Rhodosporidiobolus lusitaniae]